VLQLQATKSVNLMMLLLLGLVMMLPGCAVMGSRVVIVPPGQPCQIAKAVKAKVRAQDANGKLLEGQNDVILPEGWWVLPDPGAGKKPLPATGPVEKQ